MIVGVYGGKPSEDGGVKQDTTALECILPVLYTVVQYRTIPFTIEWYRRGPKMGIFVFPPPRAPVTPPPPRVRPGHVNRTSPPAALRNCGAERVFAPPAARKGRKIALFGP